MRALLILTLLRVVRGVAPIVNIPVLNPIYHIVTPPNVIYLFVYGATPSSSPPYPTCEQIISSQSVQYSTDGSGKNIIQVALEPDPSTSPPVLGDMVACDTSVDANCAACAASVQTVEINIRVQTYTNNPKPKSFDENTVYDYHTVWGHTCILALKKQCGPSTCPNGYYASMYTGMDSYGYVTNPVKCLQCKPGTWLTCVFTKTCTWNIPASASDPFTPPYGMYGIPGEVPVGGCYSCPTAGGGKEHYNGTQNGIWIYDHPRNPLQWICPGGADPPQFCPDGFAGANYDYTVCVCGDGNYPIDRTTCAPCPAGYQCSNGTATECPDGTYQA